MIMKLFLQCLQEDMGVVSVASNIIGNQVKKLMGYVLDGQTELAAKEHKRHLILQCHILGNKSYSHQICS